MDADFSKTLVIQVVSLEFLANLFCGWLSCFGLLACTGIVQYSAKDYAFGPGNYLSCHVCVNLNSWPVEQSILKGSIASAVSNYHRRWQLCWKKSYFYPQHCWSWDHFRMITICSPNNESTWKDFWELNVFWIYVYFKILFLTNPKCLEASQIEGNKA